MTFFINAIATSLINLISNIYFLLVGCFIAGWIANNVLTNYVANALYTMSYWF